MTKKFLLLMFGWVVASSALAQQMYKSVGPDGKVTFSDRPAVEKAKKLDVMRSYVLRPAEDFKPMPEGGLPQKQGPVTNPNATVTPAVEDAMVNVMSLTEFARRFQLMCGTTPGGAKAFTDATNQWKKRNAQYIEHQKRLLMETVSPHKRAELLERMDAYVLEINKTIPQTAAGRKDWCAGMVTQMNSGNADINKPEMLEVPITRYKAK